MTTNVSAIVVVLAFVGFLCSLASVGSCKYWITNNEHYLWKAVLRGVHSFLHDAAGRSDGARWREKCALKILLPTQDTCQILVSF